MENDKLFNGLSVVSTLGLVCWMFTEFYGGMIFNLIVFFPIIILIILLYGFSFIETIVSIIKQGLSKNKFRVIVHSLLIFGILLSSIFKSDLFKSKRVMTAVLKDDQYNYTLIFRENGSCENEINGSVGYFDKIYGEYKLLGDTIVFTRIPYKNDFLPDTILIDKKENAIFIAKDEQGNFSKNKGFLNHFEIQ